MRVLVVIALLARSMAAFCVAGDLAPLPIGSTFPSPNGRFIARLTDEDKDGRNVEIADTQSTGLAKAAVGTPLLSLRWTSDSRTMVAIEHLAGGSQTSIIHFDGQRWNWYDVIPPGGELGHFEVIKQQLGENTVELIYKVTKEKENGELIGAYTCRMIVDTASGKVSHIQRRSISLETYGHLRYVPPT